MARCYRYPYDGSRAAISRCCAGAPVVTRVLRNSESAAQGQPPPGSLTSTVNFPHRQIRGCSVGKSRFDNKLQAVLKQAKAGTPVTQLGGVHCISSATSYQWRSKLGGMDASVLSQLRELPDENRRLKQMQNDAQLNAELLNEAMIK
ncbi:hypothetical protein EZM97_20145 [Dyella soli]|uniref:Transposase n=1 Tax=Dyella soli TaxID=522319 RepID=A0A4R0YST8_9GAMM|nr:hypothetical protein EZM97_20145 [Dyella soli]